MKTLILIILFLNISYSQSNDENKSLFKLGSTPFISKSRWNINLSYGINYGSPSYIIQMWILPDDQRSIMFDNITGSISAGNELEGYIKYISGYSLAYNNSYLGEKFRKYRTDFGVKWKLINSKKYVPGAAIELNSIYPVSVSIGSSSQSFKYYASVDWGFYYLLLPHRYSIGAAYSVTDNLNIFIEGNYEGQWDVTNPNQSARTGFDVSIFDIVHLDIALFYFGFKFTEIIPGRNGLAWENPDHLLTMPEKNNYFLLSSSVSVNLDLLK
jgi:hypothetical protein